MEPRRQRRALQLPARAGREAVAGRGQRDEAVGQSQLQGRPRHPPRVQPPRAVRQSPIRAVVVQSRAHRAARRWAAAWAWPRSCSATSRASTRYISTSTEARERQWRHAYYAQDTWRVNPEADAQLRVAPRRHQPADRQRAGERHVGRSVDRPRPGRRRRRHRSGRQRRRTGSTGRRASARRISSMKRPCIRGGYGRSYDLGVFGSLFGHTVTQNLPVLANQVLNRPNQFASVFNLAAGPPAPSSRAGWIGRDVPVAGRRHATRGAAQDAAAGGGCVERHAPSGS